jgi:hypothetical protein
LLCLALYAYAVETGRLIATNAAKMEVKICVESYARMARKRYNFQIVVVTTAFAPLVRGRKKIAAILLQRD